MLSRNKFVWVSAVASVIAALVLRLDGNAAKDDATNHRLAPTVRDFGAVGDGRTDDTAAIQRAVDRRAGAIVFPTGSYRLTQTVIVDLDRVGFTSLTADGSARVVMAGSGPAFRFIGTHGGTADPQSIKPEVWERQRMPIVDGLEIVGEHAEADGIEAAGTMQLTVTRTNIRGVRHAIHLVERNRNVLIANCHLYHNRGAGVFLDRVNLHQTNISGCHISYNVGGGVVVRGGEVRNVHITGCDIEANMSPDSPPAANVWFDCTDGSMAEAAIVGCTIQHESKAAGSANIRIQGRGVFPRKGELIAVNCGHVTIADNVLSDVKTNIELRGARGVTIVGNTFWQGYEHNLFVEDCSHVVVGSNVMERNPLYGYTVEAKNGVVFRGCRDCSINGLHLHNVRECDAGLILDNCQRLHVSNCTLLDCENAGLLLNNVRDSRIADCFIRDDRDPLHPSTPIRAIAGGGTKLIDNTFTGELDLAGD